MPNDTAIRIESLQKVYRTYASPKHRLMELMSGGKSQYAQENWALDDISFEIKKGDRLGVVGDNGSGKSTLLKIIAGVLTPTNGLVDVSGRISALLELGAGFHHELSGIDNIRQFCLLHGMSVEEASQCEHDIIEFSELKGAIHHPIKTYSSGMAVRLGFACAVYVRPDILIVDEALSVGDSYFQNKCLHKIKSLLDEGTTFIYVTHGADAVRSLCNKGLWLENGRMKAIGSAAEVAASYQSSVYKRALDAGFTDSLSSTEPDESANKISTRKPNQVSAIDVNAARSLVFSQRVEPLRTGSGEVRIEDIVLLDKAGSETDELVFGEPATIRVFYRCLKRFDRTPSLTVGITDVTGKQLVHFNSATSGTYVQADLSVSQMMEFSFINTLCPGDYGLIGGIGVLSRHTMQKSRTVIDHLLDYCAGGTRFSVTDVSDAIDVDLWGVVAIEYQVKAFILS